MTGNRRTPAPAGRPGQQAGRPDRMDGAAGATVDFGPLPGYLGFRLRRAQAASFRHLDQAARGLDLTPGQFSLLTLLDASPGLSQKAVSQAFGVDTSTISPVLDALVRRDLVTRHRAERDRRSYVLALSVAGRRLLARMRRHVEAQEALMAGALAPAEHTALLGMLGRITDALDSGGDEP